MDENKKEGGTIRSEQEKINKGLTSGFSDIARHEVMIKRMEEVKRDSIKIKLLEDVLKKLGEIHLELKNLNERNEKYDKNREMEKKAAMEEIKERYV